jgi:hypothetical protein
VDEKEISSNFSDTLFRRTLYLTFSVETNLKLKIVSDIKKGTRYPEISIFLFEGILMDNILNTSLT